MREQHIHHRQFRGAFYTHLLTLCSTVLLQWSGAGMASAQGLPKSQPKILTIYREHVKVGRAAQHMKFEMGYPAALEKAKSPDYYLAMVSLTGPSEAWFVMPQQSFSAIGDSMKRDQSNPVLSAETDRLDLADADNINAVELIRAAAMPELSIGAFPDITKARFAEISIFRIRPGREQQFEDIAKSYASALKRVSPNAAYRVYAVVAGMSQPTYLIFSTMEKYGELDQRMAEGQELFKKATPEEMAKLQKFSDVAEHIESNHFRVDPGASYVPKETRQTDPEFWMPK